MRCAAFTTKQDDENQRKRTLFSILVVVCIDNFGFSLVFSLFAPLLLNPDYGFLNPSMGIPERQLWLGILFLAFPFSQFFGAPLLGDLADSYGRKKVFYITIIGTMLGFFFSGVAIAFKSYIFLFVVRLLTGFFAGNFSICLSSIADLSHDAKSRAKNFSYATVIGGISWPIAILIGGYFSDPTVSSYFSPQLPFYIATGMSLFSLWFIAKLFTETHPKRAHFHINLFQGVHHIITAIKIKAMRPYFFVLLFWMTGWGLTVQWYPVYSTDRFKASQELVSWGLVLQGVFWVIGGLFINRFLLKRWTWTSKPIALLGLIWAAVFVCASHFGNVFWSFSWIYFMAPLGSSIAMSNILNLLSLSAPDEIQGKVMGFSQSMLALGWIIVPLIGAWIGDVNVSLYYLVAAAILFLGFLSLLPQKSSKIELK